MDKNEKELILDFYFRCGSDEHIDKARDLIAGNPEAAQLYASLEETLTQLDSVKYEPCPDNLVEITVKKLMLAAAQESVLSGSPQDMHSHTDKISLAAIDSQQQLKKLIAREQFQEAAAKRSFWRNFGEVLATAAVILIVAGVLFPPLKLARQSAWQQICQMQLANIGKGISNYSSDHNGKLPAVATLAGAPWWKVGYKPKSAENLSNTRHLWLLVKHGYVEPTDFVCLGKRQGRAIQFKSSQAKNYNDFPARRYITYSLRLKCDKLGNGDVKGRKVMMADLNPLFEKLPEHANPLSLKMNKKLLSRNSINHNRRGQNVLFRDGGVVFQKTRFVDSDISKDDIYTLKDTSFYQGSEMPACKSDAFLAP